MTFLNLLNVRLKFIALALATWLLFNDAMAQLQRPHISPSPNAAAIVQSANVEVGHYTGIANVSVPIHNLLGKGISIPISLDYVASGVRVQDVSTSAGLGWNLNASGFAITRVVRGFPDGALPYCEIDVLNSEKVNRNAIWWIDQTESCDGERDIFYFSFPGRKGKMYLAYDGSPQTMPYQDLAISPGTGTASIGYWKIVDEAGYTYYFGQTSASQEQTTFYTGNKATNSFTEKHTYISTWYLSKIEAPSGLEVATFSYVLGAEVSYFNVGTRVIDCTGGTVQRIDAKIKVNAPKYVSSVSTDLSSAWFSYDEARSDLEGALRLASITVKDVSQTERKKFHLEHGCFENRFGVSCTRLKLAALKEGLTNPVTTHTFIYNETALLPVEDSYYTDHYGFFNYNSAFDFNASATGGRGEVARSVPKITGICEDGRLKGPNGGGALALILREIQYSLGGKTVFTYNANGTARINSISQYDGTSLISQSTFSYDGAQGYKTPTYHYYDFEANPDQLIRSSNSYNSIYDLNGVAIGYSTVTETLLDGSKIVRTFKNFLDYPDDAPIVGRYRYNTNTATFKGTSDINSSPFTPHSSNAWMRGLPNAIEIRDNQDNLLQKHEYDYKPGLVLSTAWNMAVEVYRTVPGDYHFYVGDYMLRSQVVYLDNEKVYNYDQADLNRSTVTTTTYTYHNTLKTFPKMVVTKLSTDANAPEQKLTLRYPIDVAGSGSSPSSPQPRAEGIWSLLTNHVIVPVEKLTYYKDIGSTFKIIGGELSTFRRNASRNKPLQMEVYALDLLDPATTVSEAALTSSGTIFSFDSRYRLLETYNYDDATVKLSSINSSSGVTQHYEWGHNNSVITASYTMLGPTQYKTQYAYNTVYGPESVTDPNSRVSRFEYDKFGRLKLIKDTEQNILTHYRYNNKEVSEFGIDFTVSNDLSLSPITFASTINGETAGVTKYVWDFGDGQVLETTSLSVNHTYTTTGTFTAKLSKINPEFGTVMTSKSIVIYSPIGGSIVGPNSINLCDPGSSYNFSLSASGGCPGTKTYSWTVAYPNGSNGSLGSGSTVTFNTVNLTGNYEFKCTVNDSCGHQYITTKWVNVYKQGGCP